jgi:putative DNA primase/helicase
MQVIVFQRGDGGNGKSIATGVLASLLENLAVNVEFEKLGEPGNRDLARIPGRRALLSTESKKTNRRIPEDILKRLSDGEPLISDQKFQVPFEYRPVGKIWWSMNHLPRVTDTTASIWRRLQVLPYNRKISPNERDVHLAEKLLVERSGILNWALIGLERVASRRQFTSVQQVAETVDDYRRGSDPVRMFLDENCHTEPSPGRTQLWTAASPLFDAYTEWSRRNQFDRLGSMSSKEFANEMKRLGYPGKRSSDSVRYPVLLKLPEAHDGN